MPFVEVFAPQGAVRPDQQALISKGLVAEVMRGEGAPDTEIARAISWLVWHPVDHWSIGGQLIEPDEPPRYMVRVSVPAGSLIDEKRADIIARVTQVLADADDDGDRLYREPSAWVQLVEIADGNWGALGRVFRFADISELVSTGAPA